MIFTPTELAPVCVIDIEPLRDERGFFARSFCRDEFARHGLPEIFVQSSISFNRRKGTLRGLHYQAEPAAEGKLVRCTRGAIYDVVVDIRPGASTFRRWLGFELSEDTARAVYIPPGFAHGFQTLTENAEILYEMTVPYQAELARGLRWNDPAFAIDWPLAEPFLSPRDAAYPNFTA